MNEKHTWCTNERCFHTKPIENNVVDRCMAYPYKCKQCEAEFHEVLSLEIIKELIPLSRKG